MTPAEVGRLTPWQVNELYGHPRDKNGRILDIPEDSEPESEEDSLKTAWRESGLEEWRVEQLWSEYTKRR